MNRVGKSLVKSITNLRHARCKQGATWYLAASFTEHLLNTQFLFSFSCGILDAELAQIITQIQGITTI
jgi:predicted metal-dependent peptidase